MSDIRDILGLPTAAKSEGGEAKPRDKVKKEAPLKKPDGVSREVWLLQSGSREELAPPLIPTHNVGLKQKRKTSSVKVSWQWKPFSNSARKDGLQLKHWVKILGDEPPSADYAFAKYNKKAELVVYNDEEYASLVHQLDPAWSRAETDHLLELCSMFDLRFVQIADRFQYPNRSVEDLKQRYYSLAKALLEARASCPEEANIHPIVSVGYNHAHERERKRCLDYLLSRTPQQFEKEAEVLEEAAEIEERRRVRALSVPAASMAAAKEVSTEARAAGVIPRHPHHMPFKQHQGPGRPAGQARAGGDVIMGLGVPEPLPAWCSEEVEVPDVTAPTGPLSLMPPKPLVPNTQALTLNKPEPGVYLRSKYAATLGSSPALLGNLPRAAKRVDQVCEEFGVKALVHPSQACMNTWLRLRMEVAQLLDLKKNAARVHDAAAVPAPSSGMGVTPDLSSSLLAGTPGVANPSLTTPCPIPSGSAAVFPGSVAAPAQGSITPKGQRSHRVMGSEMDAALHTPQMGFEEMPSPGGTGSAERSSKRGGPKRKAPAPARFEDSPPRRNADSKRPRLGRRID